MLGQIDRGEFFIHGVLFASIAFGGAPFHQAYGSGNETPMCALT
jgi:hypothetical protein